jgi:hypothetical protein
LVVVHKVVGESRGHGDGGDSSKSSLHI